MTLNERILDFLDGSLAADDEAELLHTLSVSPEKRNMLREFMQQRAVLAQDARSIAVPYAAEQRLWSRLGMVMPAAVEEATPVVVPVTSQVAGFLSRAFTGASAVLSTLTLVAGIGIGYFVSQSNITPATKVEVAAAPGNLSPMGPMGQIGQAATNRTDKIQRIYIRVPSAPMMAAAMMPVGQPLAENVQPQEPQPQANKNEAPDLAMASALPVSPVAYSHIGGDGVGIKPIFHETREVTEHRSLLQRFEFRVNESFGRQTPNSAQTNVSLPLITNSSVGTMFQVLPHSSLLWLGASYGTANVTLKNLFTRAGNPIDPLQEVLASDTVHAQTSYVAGIAEIRLPAFATADLTFSGGYGLATLGRMMFGEIGLHYNVSNEVGFQTGFRVLRFTYDLSGEKAAAIKSGNGSLVIPNAVEAAAPSFNTEINTGLFFHF